MLAGVAGGVADRLDMDPSLVRIIWALLIILTGGLALLVYIVMAIVVPEDPWEDEPIPSPGDGPADDVGSTAATAVVDTSTTSASAGEATTATVAPMPAAAPMTASRRSRRRERGGPGGGALVLGLLLIVLGGVFLLRQLIPGFDFGNWWPVLLIGLGLVLIIVAVVPGRRSD
jgi:phage shock protein C